MKKGFTLVEILGAILILVGLTAVISQVSYGVLQRSEKSRRVHTAVRLLQQKMMELESSYKKFVEDLPEEEEGQFQDEKDFIWSYKVRSLELPSSLLLLSSQNLDQSPLNIQVTNMIREVLTNTIQELKLTVTYTKSKRPLSYSLVSYFINYQKVPEYIQSLVAPLIPLLNQGGDLFPVDPVESSPSEQNEKDKGGDS